MTIANPSGNPANLDTLTGSFREILNKTIQRMDGMIPARVINYIPGPPERVQVQPLIQVVTTSGDLINRAQIASLPVLQLGSGGFFIHFPLQIGDLGWIFASDRDIAQFLQTYTQSPPATSRYKDFSSALFIPDVMKGYTVSDEDSDNLVIQSINGEVKISLSETTITLSAPNVTLNSDIQITGNLDMIGTPTLTGNLRVVGNITASGSITPDVP